MWCIRMSRKLLFSQLIPFLMISFLPTYTMQTATGVVQAGAPSKIVIKPAEITNIVTNVIRYESGDIIQFKISWDDNMPKATSYNVVITTLNRTGCSEPPCSAYGVIKEAKQIIIPENPMAHVDQNECGFIFGCNYLVKVETSNAAISGYGTVSVPYCVMELCSCQHAEYLPEVISSVNIPNNETIIFNWLIKYIRSINFIEYRTNVTKNQWKLYLIISEQTNPLLTWGGKLLPIAEQLYYLKNISHIKTKGTMQGTFKIRFPKQLVSKTTLKLRSYIIDDLNCGGPEHFTKVTVPEFIGIQGKNETTDVKLVAALVIISVIFLCIIILVMIYCCWKRNKKAKYHDDVIAKDTQYLSKFPGIFEMEDNINYVDKYIENLPATNENHKCEGSYTESTFFDFSDGEESTASLSKLTEDAESLYFISNMMHQYLNDADKTSSIWCKYPTLKEIALFCNTPLTYSGPVERLFFFAGIINSPMRGRLTDFSFEKLVLPKEAQAKGLADFYETPHTKIHIGPEIGEGAFGRVYKAVAENIRKVRGNTVVAVKQLKNNPTADEVAEFLSEIEMLKRVGTHKNIVSLLGCCTIRAPYLMVMEFVGRGDLLTYLRAVRLEVSNFNLNAKINFTSSRQAQPKEKVKYIELQVSSQSIESNSDINHEPKSSVAETTYTIIEDEDLNEPFEFVLDHKELYDFALQIVNGMRFLEVQKITHRDLAARNILIDTNKTLKISDFGLSRHGIYTNTKTRKLPLRWLSIEAIRDNTYSNKSDVWAYGVVLWEIGTLGASPYPTISNHELIPYLVSGKRLEKPEICTDQLFTIMLRCWDEKIEKRPTFVELYNILSQNAAYVDINYLSDDYVFPPIK